LATDPAGGIGLGICRMSATFCYVNVSPPSVDFATHTPLCGSVDPNAALELQERHVHVAVGATVGNDCCTSPLATGLFSTCPWENSSSAHARPLVSPPQWEINRELWPR